MGHLRTDNVTPDPELEAIRLVVESLFRAGWTIEMVANTTSPPGSGAPRFCRKRKEVGSGIFLANRLEDVVPFLNRLATVVDERPGGASAP